MENKNVSEIIEEVRRDISKIFNESSTSEGPSLSSDANIFSLQKYKKVHPEKIIVPDSEAYKNVCFETINADSNIKDDVKNMRIQLKQTYDLLINARDTLDGINFGNLKHKIKDLHVYPTEAEIDQLLKKQPLHENLEDLTSFMKERFKGHTGEIADIPEINSFFRTCTELQRGLKDLETQTKDLEELETRVIKATEDEKERVVKMKHFLNVNDNK